MIGRFLDYLDARADNWKLLIIDVVLGFAFFFCAAYLLVEGIPNAILWMF